MIVVRGYKNHKRLKFRDKVNVCQETDLIGYALFLQLIFLEFVNL